MCIVIICLPVCHVIIFGTNLSFLIKTFPYAIKKSGQNLKALTTNIALKTKKNIIFKLRSVAINCPRPESGPLKENVSV